MAVLTPEQRRRRVSEAYDPIPISPTGGMNRALAANELPLEVSPDMMNCFVAEGILRKRPGLAQFPAAHEAMPGPITGVYSTQDEENNTHLVALYPTGAAKWDLTLKKWVEMTGPALTGSAGQPFSFETSQNAIVFSQGVDRVMRHSIATQNLDYAVLSENCPAARYLTRFVNRLILGYTNEAGISKPFRIRRPISGDHTNWTGVGSGFTDLLEYPYHLRGLRKLGELMAVYTEKSIHLATRTGVPAAPFALDTKTEDVGLGASRTLKVLPGSAGHIFLGNDDFYLFDGNREIPLGLPVRDLVFATLSPAALQQDFSEVLTDTKEYITFLATGGSEWPDTVWVYNYGRNIWYPWSAPFEPVSGGLHRNDDTKTIDDLEGTISESTWEFDSRSLTRAHPSLLTGHTDGKVYKWTVLSNSDAGQPIACRWTSRDFESDDIDPQQTRRMITLRQLVVVYRTTGAQFSLNISISTDGGSTWDGPYELVCPAELSGRTRDIVLTRQFTGPRIRWKMEQNSAEETFQVLQFVPTFELREPISL